jgi:hypothetical protein
MFQLSESEHCYNKIYARIWRSGFQPLLVNGTFNIEEIIAAYLHTYNTKILKRAYNLEFTS